MNIMVIKVCFNFFIIMPTLLTNQNSDINLETVTIVIMAEVFPDDIIEVFRNGSFLGVAEITTENNIFNFIDSTTVVGAQNYTAKVKRGNREGISSESFSVNFICINFKTIESPLSGSSLKLFPISSSNSAYASFESGWGVTQENANGYLNSDTYLIEPLEFGLTKASITAVSGNGFVTVGNFIKSDSQPSIFYWNKDMTEAVDLGIKPNGYAIGATSISFDGQKLCGDYTDDYGDDCSFYLSRQNELGKINLGPFIGGKIENSGSCISAIAISNYNSIILGSGDSGYCEPGSPSAFWYYKTETSEFIEVPRPAELTDFIYALQISENGDVITGSTQPSNVVWSYNVSSGVFSYPVFPSTIQNSVSFPKASANGNFITGLANVTSSDKTAWLWDLTQNIVSIFEINENFKIETVKSISGNGNYVIGSGNDSSTGVQRSFKWSLTEGFLIFDGDGSTDFVAEKINDTGDITIGSKNNFITLWSKACII